MDCFVLLELERKPYKTEAFMLAGNQTNPLPNIMLFEIISVNLQLHLCVKIFEFPGFGAIMASRHHFIKENLRDGVQMLDGKECEGFG